MALSDDLATLTARQGVGAYEGVGTGTPILVGKMPDSPDKVLVIRRTGGQPDEDDFTSGVDRPTFQLVARGEQDDSLTPEALADAAYIALHRLRNVTSGESNIISIRAIQPPFELGWDDNGRARYAFNIVVRLHVQRPHGG